MNFPIRNLKEGEFPMPLVPELIVHYFPLEPKVALFNTEVWRKFKALRAW